MQTFWELLHCDHSCEQTTHNSHPSGNLTPNDAMYEAAPPYRASKLAMSSLLGQEGRLQPPLPHLKEMLSNFRCVGVSDRQGCTVTLQKGMSGLHPMVVHSQLIFYGD